MSRKGLAIFAITRHGIEVAVRLKAALPSSELYVSQKLSAYAPPDALSLPFPMGSALAGTFTAYDCHVFVISVGAVVRMIAPLLRDKKVDPAVVCVDDDARWSICVLSGHAGRGNAFTEQVAAALGAQAVITTASDVRGTLSVDILGRQKGWMLDDPERNVTRGCAAVVNAAPVLFVQETGEPDWWPLDEPLPQGVSYAESLDGVDPAAYEMLLIASDRDLGRTHPKHWENAVVYRPKSLVLGIGCDNQTPADLVERGVRQLLNRHGLAMASVRGLATIDVKAAEPAIRQLSEHFHWPVQTYPANQLDVVRGIENPSQRVKKHVGTCGVAEPATLLAAGARKLLVGKQSYTEEGAGRSMTLAIARIPFAKRKA